MMVENTEMSLTEIYAITWACNEFQYSHPGEYVLLVVTHLTVRLHCDAVCRVFLSYACLEPLFISQEAASSSAECSLDKPPVSFVRGQDSTMWGIVWVSLQGHRSVSVHHHFLLQVLQCPCSMQKRFNRDHCCRGRSKPDCWLLNDVMVTQAGCWWQTTFGFC